MKPWLTKYAWFITSLTSPEQPVYHQSLSFDAKIVDRYGDTSIPAKCGRILDRWSQDTGRRYRTSTMVWRGHADKFARPCRRCYPETKP